MKKFELSELQANAILEMRLQKLTSLEQQKIIDELEELQKKIDEFKGILKDTKKQYKIITDGLGAIKSAYGEKRQTQLDQSSVESLNFEATDLIADEEVVITLTDENFIKRMPRDTFRRQKRGGRGVRGVKNTDTIKNMLIASTHASLLFFSNRGKIFVMKVHEVQETSREARGRSLKALINLASNESISAFCAIPDFESDQHVVMVSKKGILKKAKLNAFRNARRGGIIAIGLRNDDELAGVCLSPPGAHIILCSRLGNALRCDTSKIRSQGRSATGIIGMRLSEGDTIVGMDLVDNETTLLVISERGYAKRMSYKNFSVKGRGGLGMTYIKVSEKNGPAVRVSSVKESDDIVVMARSGMTIRLSGKDVPIIGRSTIGVKVVNLGENDIVSDIALLEEA